MVEVWVVEVRLSSVRTGAVITVAPWRMLPASEPTLAASATTVIAATILSRTSSWFTSGKSAA